MLFFDNRDKTTPKKQKKHGINRASVDSNAGELPSQWKTN
jgi:hypothetical protein